MQSLYMDFVSARDRKVFGEYYTPDWLAALIVQETLDETWRSKAIEQAETGARTSTRLDGVGVLDPTWGSGTFLYHAARRILDAPEMRELSPDARPRAAAPTRPTIGPRSADRDRAGATTRPRRRDHSPLGAIKSCVRRCFHTKRHRMCDAPRDDGQTPTVNN